MLSIEFSRENRFSSPYYTNFVLIVGYAMFVHFYKWKWDTYDEVLALIMEYSNPMGQEKMFIETGSNSMDWSRSYGGIVEDRV